MYIPCPRLGKFSIISVRLLCLPFLNFVYGETCMFDLLMILLESSTTSSFYFSIFSGLSNHLKFLFKLTVYHALCSASLVPRYYTQYISLSDFVSESVHWVKSDSGGFHCFCHQTNKQTNSLGSQHLRVICSQEGFWLWHSGELLEVDSLCQRQTNRIFSV